MNDFIKLAPSGDYKKEDFVYSMKHCSSETINSSNPADRLKNKHGKDILKWGWKVVPYLIEYLEKEVDFDSQLFLYKITQLCLWNPEDAGNVAKMRTAWLSWGLKNVPLFHKRYEYFGKIVKIWKVNPYPSIGSDKQTSVCWQVWIEDVFGCTTDVDFKDLSLL